MLVDDVLSPKIPEPMPRHGGFRMLVIGAPGSSKTSFALSHILKGGCYHKVFDHLHVVMPANSRASFETDPFESHSPKKTHTELSAEVLQAVIASARAAAAHGENSLLFVDDCAYVLKEKPIERLMREIFFNARHLRLSTILISQTLRSVSNKLRLSASHLVTFAPANRLEAGVIGSEFLFLDPKMLSTLLGQCFQERFDQLLVDVAKREVWANFQRLELPAAW